MDNILKMYTGLVGFAVIWLVFYVFCQWRIFSKAGQHGWTALVPVYNSYVYYEIIYGNGWKFLICLIPIFGALFNIVATFRLAKCFNKGAGFGIGLVLFPVIFLPILALGKSEYYDTIDSFM